MENALKRLLVPVTSASISITNITTAVFNTVVTVNDSSIINLRLQTTTVTTTAQPVPNNMSPVPALLGETV